jgi:hypothetical protein
MRLLICGYLENLAFSFGTIQEAVVSFKRDLAYIGFVVSILYIIINVV